MKDYDVVVIGGGINGLTSAAYLAKAGLSVGVFEARGQCGAHCDTIELGQPGFLHNTHAVWLVPAMSPAMADLELERFGLDLRGTDILFAKPFLDGTNTVQALEPAVTQDSVARHSERDSATLAKIRAYSMEHGGEALVLNQQAIFAAPTSELADRMAAFNDGLLRSLDVPLSGDDVNRMTGFELLEVLFESEAVRTLPGALGEFTGQWPLNRRGRPPGALPDRDDAHGRAHGEGRLPRPHPLPGQVPRRPRRRYLDSTCPVDKILVEDGRACGDPALRRRPPARRGGAGPGRALEPHAGADLPARCWARKSSAPTGPGASSTSTTTIRSSSVSTTR